VAVQVLGSAYIRITPQMLGFDRIGAGIVQSLRPAEAALVRIQVDVDAIGTAARRAAGDVGDIGDAARRAGGDADGLRGDLEEAGQAGAGAAEETESGWTRAFGKVKEGAKTGFLAIGAAAAGAFTVGLIGAIDAESANSRLQAQLGLSDAEAERLGAVAGSLYAHAYGESLGEVNDAIASVVQNVEGMGTASSAVLETFTAQAFSVANVLEADVGEVANAVGKIMSNNLAPSAEAALDVIARGSQLGGNRAGDLLDTFGEYSPLFAQLGLSADQAMGLLVQGLQAGARDTDFLADAIKESTLLIQEMPEATATAFTDLRLDSAKFQADVGAGGERASAAYSQLFAALRAVKDPIDQNRIAVGIFGTKAEDLQDSLFALDPSTAVAALGQVGGAATKLDADLNQGLASSWETLKRTVISGLAGLAAVAVPPLASLATTISGGLGTAFAAIPGAVSALGTAFSSGSLSGAEGFLGVVERIGVGARGLYDAVQPGVRAITDFATNSAWPTIQNLGGIFQRLWVDVQPVAQVVAGVLVVAFNALGFVLSNVVGPVISGLTGFFRANQTVITALAIAIGVAVVAWKAYQLAVVVVTTVQYLWQVRTLLMGAALRVLQGVMVAMRVAVLALNTAFLANPIALVVVAVVALGAAIFYLYKRSETARAIIDGAFRGIMVAVRFVWDWVKSNWPLLLGILTGPIGLAVVLIIRYWDQIKAAGIAVWNWISGLPGMIGSALASLGMIIAQPFITGWQTVSGWVETAWGWFSALPGRIGSALLSIFMVITTPHRLAFEFVLGVIETAWGWFSALPGRIGGALVSLFMILTTPHRLAFEFVLGVINTGVGWFAALPGRVGGALSAIGSTLSRPFVDGWNTVSSGISTAVGWFTGLPGKIGGALSGIAGTITSPFRTAFNSIAGMWNRSVGKIGFTFPDWVPGLRGQGFSVPDIPLLAAGGLFTAPGWAVVGDQGPELMWGGRGAAVAPLPPSLDLSAQRARTLAAAGTGRGPLTLAPVVHVDARGATDPAAVEAAVQRAVAELLRELTQLVHSGEGVIG
jgi:hypothetical protein